MTDTNGLIVELQFPVSMDVDTHIIGMCIDRILGIQLFTDRTSTILDILLTSDTDRMTGPMAIVTRGSFRTT